MRSEGEAGRGVHRRRRGQHVAGVAERGDVAERGHVSGQGGRVERAALGEVLQRVVHLFALFGLARHFSVSGLDAFLLHGQGSVNLNRDQFFFFFYFLAGSERAQAVTPQHGRSARPATGICFQGLLPPHPLLSPSRGPRVLQILWRSSDCPPLSVAATE